MTKDEAVEAVMTAAADLVEPFAENAAAPSTVAPLIASVREAAEALWDAAQAAMPCYSQRISGLEYVHGVRGSLPDCIEYSEKYPSIPSAFCPSCESRRKA